MVTEDTLTTQRLMRLVQLERQLRHMIDAAQLVLENTETGAARPFHITFLEDRLETAKAHLS